MDQLSAQAARFSSRDQDIVAEDCQWRACKAEFTFGCLIENYTLSGMIGTSVLTAS